ncbi:gfo/Idh/MocA family oxidoreductase, partial [Vibrio alginolyticus]|nr:gfo/Idh/MocA family oxidoreductase [Vibrio alginolyticus]MDW2183936.1 gfo/Idh/MocA family oxidoreductase [Vibrio sp. 1762]
MKIGIIGLGDIAQKAYLPAITQLPNVELVFCTRDAKTLSSLAQQYRI